jgi:hypothetical protein
MYSIMQNRIFVFFTWCYSPRTLFVIGHRSSFKSTARIVFNGTEEFEIFRIVGIPENGFLVQEGNVTPLLEAHESTGVLGVRVSVGASDTGSVGAAEFAKFVRVVA